MKGLLVKDIQLLKNSVKLLMIMVLMIFFFLFMNKDTMDSVGFVVGYGSFLSSMLVLNTISYDDFNKGLSFLFTLPVSRKLYVTEKYTFGIITGTLGWFLSCACVTLFMVFRSTNVQWKEVALFFGLFLIFTLLVISLMLPIQLKFGGDNGRIALFVVVLGVVAIAFFIKKLSETFHLDLGGMLRPILDLGTTALAIGIVAITAVFLAVSFGVSTRIVQNKQF